MCGLELPQDPRLIVGSQTSDDAGVYQLDEQTALIQTLDFFTPIVDDPYSFGMIAAANALSDVYAMGGKPLLCMNILACPAQSMEQIVFRRVIEGGLAKVREAGALLVGGHSITDEELKYGLSVTGLVHPKKVLLNSGARPGDVLLLTKPIGTGILSTAMKGGLGGPEDEQRIVEVMSTLNRQPIEWLRRQPEDIQSMVHGATDITGFGLIGHLHETALASGVRIVLQMDRVPVLQGVREMAEMGIIPEGAYTNKKYYQAWVDNTLPEMDWREMAGYDPQTSGGLLLALEKDAAGLLLDALAEQGYPYACGVVGYVTEATADGKAVQLV